MLLPLIIVPFLAGIAAFAIRRDGMRRALLAIAAAIHFAFVVLAWNKRPIPIFDGWIGLDALGLLFLSIASLLFLAASLYGIGYLAHEGRAGAAPRHDYDEELIFTNAPEAVLTGCLLFFLGTMSLVCLSRHLGLLWVAVEATTLASAPLIYFHRHRRSLEAVWKYLIICSIGIALALLGNFLIAVATMKSGGAELPLIIDNLVQSGRMLNPLWLKAAFIFLIVGYGTKMGLAPMHTWLPDAHSESPSLVSALLSGALLNCAFLGILRAYQICAAAELAPFCNDLLILFGLVSMAFAAVFILGQADYKRMLAYSSVEHMGILALGVGLGGGAVFGAMFHAINHSLTKGMLFLAAGNVLALYKTKSTADVRGIGRALPITGVLWLAGFFSITGSPPFGTFLSEFTIMKSAFDLGRPGVGIAYLALLALIFIAMATIVLRMVQGCVAGIPACNPADANRDQMHQSIRESWLSIALPAFLGLVILVFGLYLPPFVSSLLHEAAQLVGGQ